VRFLIFRKGWFGSNVKIGIKARPEKQKYRELFEKFAEE
jgi:hypothetical protein